MQEITICNQSKGSKFLSQIPMMNFKPGLQQEGFVAIQTKESPRMKACIKVLFYLFRCFLRFSTRISNVPTSYLVSFLLSKFQPDIFPVTTFGAKKVF